MGLFASTSKSQHKSHDSFHPRLSIPPATTHYNSEPKVGLLVLFLRYWGLNPGPRGHKASYLPLSCTSSLSFCSVNSTQLFFSHLLRCTVLSSLTGALGCWPPPPMTIPSHDHIQSLPHIQGAHEWPLQSSTRSKRTQKGREKEALP